MFERKGQRIDPVGLSRYHASANTVLCVGIVSGALFANRGWQYALLGFLAGAITTFTIAVIVHTLDTSPAPTKGKGAREENRHNP